MKTVAFDIGGVLRPVLIKGSEERNWPALRSLYCMFSSAPNWRVVITTRRPLGKETVESVEEELRKFNLPMPDEIKICLGPKTQLYVQVKPDLVVDDAEQHIREAVKLGITTLKVE